MTRTKGRSEGKIILIEGRIAARRAPIEDRLDDLAGLVFPRVKGREQAQKVIGRNLVDVVPGGFRDHVHFHLASWKRHAQEWSFRRIVRVWVLRRRRKLPPPLNVQDGPLDGAGGEVIAAQAVHGCGGALGLSLNRAGERESDRRKGQGEPEHGEQRAAGLALLETRGAPNRHSRRPAAGSRESAPSP